MNDAPDEQPAELQEPYIPAEVSLAEITFKAIVLGIALSVLQNRRCHINLGAR